MLRVNFSAYNTYVTDSLYQWDKNQKLVISGLNLSVNPEVRFTNEIMDKSIVRQSVCEDGVLTVNIPNSLLQYPYTIKAYIGIYEGDLFKTIECVDIPIIAQERPFDYVLTDSDGEIYSFNALDNKVENSLTKYNQASGQLQESIENYQLAREEFIEGLKEANKSFKLSKIYTSITQMNAGYATDNVPLYGFVLINTGNTSDVDNAKLFVKTETKYDYVSYLVGMQGEKGEAFTFEDFTPEQLELLRGPQGVPGRDGVTPTIQDWLGTEPIGSPTSALYYDGEKFTESPFAPREFTLESATWEQIKAIADAGKASEYFYVGEEKKVILDSGEEITFLILGFNHDTATAGGKASITFGMKHLLANTYAYKNNSSSTYEESDIVAKVIPEYLSKMPTAITQHIVPVNKYHRRSAKNSLTSMSNCKLFLFSEREIATIYYDNDIENYKQSDRCYEYYKANTNVKGLNNGKGQSEIYWLRDYVTAVYTNGDIITSFKNDTDTSIQATSLFTPKFGICFGFCI